MQTVVGGGAWPGQAEGALFWVDTERPVVRTVVPDRAAEVLRFRSAVSQALADLDIWSPMQPDIGGRVLLQGYREALQTEAWSQRVCALIDKEGLSSASAALEVADQVGGVMARSPELLERAEQLKVVARWLARRLAPETVPEGAILAASQLSPIELLDLKCPALIAGGEPPVVGTATLVWGVPGLCQDWAGRRAAIDGATVTLDPPSESHWYLHDGLLNGHPVCQLNGDLDNIQRMERKVGRPPVALVHLLEDLAAVPLFASAVAGVAIDFDRLSGKRAHPGVEFLIMQAVQTAHGAGVPIAAGGKKVFRQPDRWLALGFDALYTAGIPRGGQQPHAIRRRT